MKNKKKIILFICMLVCVVCSNVVMTTSSIGQPLLVQYGDGTGMLDFLNYYSGEQAVTALNSLGENGTFVYTRLLLIDFVFIIGTAVLFSMIMQALVKWSGLSSKWNALHWLGYVRSAFDALENVLLLIALNFLLANKLILSIAGIITLLKWVSMYLYIAVVIIVVIIGIQNKIRH